MDEIFSHRKFFCAKRHLPTTKRLTGYWPAHLSKWIIPWWRHQMETFPALLAICAGNSPHKGQWRGALMFTLICARINVWVNNRGAGDLRRNRVHYDVIVMQWHQRSIYVAQHDSCSNIVTHLSQQNFTHGPNFHLIHHPWSKVIRYDITCLGASSNITVFAMIYNTMINMEHRDFYLHVLVWIHKVATPSTTA